MDIVQDKYYEGPRRFFAMSGAIIKKNFLEFIRYPLNSLFWVIFPLVWMFPTYLLLISFAPKGTSAGLQAYTGTDSFFSYYLIGMLVGFFITNIFWTMGFSLKRLMDIGVLETIWAYPMSRVGYIIAESFYNLIEVFYSLVIMVVFTRYIFKFILPPDFWATIAWFVPFIFIMYGFGIAFAALILLYKDPNTLVDTSSFIVMTLSGSQNPPNVFPKFLFFASLALPITYFIDLVRVHSLKMRSLVPVEIEVIIIIASAVLFPFLGILFFKAVDKKCRKDGNLQAH